jgi:hypothetical protein
MLFNSTTPSATAGRAIVLVREIAALYTAFAPARPSPLPERASSTPTSRSGSASPRRRRPGRAARLLAAPARRLTCRLRLPTDPAAPRRRRLPRGGAPHRRARRARGGLKALARQCRRDALHALLAGFY